MTTTVTIGDNEPFGVLPFEIIAPAVPDETTKVIVNGQEVKGQIHGLNITMEGGHITQLALYARAIGVIRGEAIVTVDLTDAAAAAVLALDGDEVKERWMAGQGLDVDTGRLLLDIVAAMLTEGR